MGLLIDLLLVCYLFTQTWLGWRSGLLWQVTAVAALTLGLCLGLLLSPLLGSRLQGLLTPDPLQAQLAAFVFILGCVGLVLRLVALWVEVRSESGLKREERELRRGHNRILGGIFGALKGCVLSLVLVSVAATFWPRFEGWEASRLAPAFALAGRRLLPPRALDQAQAWMAQSGHEVQRSLRLRVPETRPDAPPPPLPSRAQQPLDRESTAP